MTELVLVRGDITEQDVDAVVNAANSSLLGGAGVDGAIHRVGGPAILAECQEVRATRYPDGLPTGQAVATTAGNLPARWVIHTVGPVWSPREDQSHLLASCYRESLRVADELGAQTVAFLADRRRRAGRGPNGPCDTHIGDRGSFRGVLRRARARLHGLVGLAVGSPVSAAGHSEQVG